MRAFLIVASMVAGVLCAYYGQPYAHGNSDAVTILITVMTVFAGFLVAILTLVGDPALIPDGSWRAVEVRRQNIENRLITYFWLFVLYLLAIGFLFIGVLVEKAPHISEEWETWIERLYLFFGTTSFFLTLGLPRALWRLQMARLDAEGRRRRKGAGLKD